MSKVIGKGGETIRQIQSDCNVQIRTDSKMNSRFIIEAKEEVFIKTAKEAIMKIISDADAKRKEKEASKVTI